MELYLTLSLIVNVMLLVGIDCQSQCYMVFNLLVSPYIYGDTWFDNWCQTRIGYYWLLWPALLPIVCLSQNVNEHYQLD